MLRQLGPRACDRLQGLRAAGDHGEPPRDVLVLRVGRPKLGEPQRGHEAPQVVHDRLRKIRRRVGLEQQQPRAVGKIPRGDVGAFRFARDVGAPIRRRQLHQRRAAAQVVLVDVRVAADLELAVLEPHRPAAHGAVGPAEQVQRMRQVRGREQPAPGAPGPDGGREGHAQREEHAAARREQRP